MSLKRYLFLLIALFVLGLSATQLFFVNYIQQQIATEVEDKSRALSKQALKLLADTIPNAKQDLLLQQTVTSFEPAKPSIVVRIENTPNRAFPLTEDYRFVTGEQTKTITITQAPSKPVGEFREALQGLLHEISFKRLGNSHAFSVVNQQTSQLGQHIIQFDQKNSVIAQYFSWLIIGTIVLTVMGLLLAYWLAKHISAPLGALSGGFVRLQHGELGSQVKPSGIQEIRETLTSFNKMSTRLEELNKIESRFHQQQQMAELGEVARGLAHTLRNPINTIGLAIEQISQTDMSQQERLDIAQQVRHKITHLDNTIKGLLTLTTSDLKRDQQVNVTQVINDVILEMSMTGKHRIEFSPVQDLHVLGAEVELRAMIHTLVVNAIEASPEDKSISIFAMQKQQSICIKVIDQGNGLAAKIKTDLFKPHVSTKPEGAGMGLYIAKRICQSYYQGDVSLTEKQPHGCIATLTLSTNDCETTPDE
jgi:signal transduction histidine kinase